MKDHPKNVGSRDPMVTRAHKPGYDELCRLCRLERSRLDETLDSVKQKPPLNVEMLGDTDA